MSCKCFSKPIPTSKEFGKRLELSKCSCEARYTVSENHKTFCINRTNIELSQIDKIKIDNYFESNQNIKKCDYLFIYKGQKFTYIFVELKGKNISHAIEQLETSIDSFYKAGYLNGNQVRAVIVSSRLPGNDGTVRNEKRKLNGKYKQKQIDFRLHQKNSKVEYEPLKDKFN
jgi:hypothetical protein